MNSTVCSACQLGGYAQTGFTACATCGANTYSGQQAGGCTGCPDNSQSSGGTGLAGCLCQPGYYNVFSVSQFCGACSAGYYTGYASTPQCAPCGYGRYSSASASSACQTCAAGSFQPMQAGTACTGCSAGSFSLLPGSQYCSVCAAPNYCPDGSTVTACPLGTYSNLTGLSSAAECPVCPANYFCLAPDDLEACPAYTHSAAGTTTKLDCLCNPGFVCTYHKSVRVKVTLPVTQAQYQLVQNQLIAAVASAAGVPTSQVSVISVAPLSTRRLLASSGIDVHLHAAGAHTVTDLDMHLRRRGVHGPHSWYPSHSIHPRPAI